MAGKATLVQVSFAMAWPAILPHQRLATFLVIKSQPDHPHVGLASKLHYYLNTAQTLGNDTLERQPLYLNDVFHPRSPLL